MKPLITQKQKRGAFDPEHIHCPAGIPTCSDSGDLLTLVVALSVSSVLGVGINSLVTSSFGWC